MRLKRIKSDGVLKMICLSMDVLNQDSHLINPLLVNQKFLFAFCRGDYKTSTLQVKQNDLDAIFLSNSLEKNVLDRSDFAMKTFF